MSLLAPTASSKKGGNNRYCEQLSPRVSWIPIAKGPARNRRTRHPFGTAFRPPRGPVRPLRGRPGPLRGAFKALHVSSPSLFIPEPAVHFPFPPRESWAGLYRSLLACFACPVTCFVRLIVGWSVRPSVDPCVCLSLCGSARVRARTSVCSRAPSFSVPTCHCSILVCLSYLLTDCLVSLPRCLSLPLCLRPSHPALELPTD